MGKAITITGIKQIDRRMKRLDQKVQKKILRHSMREGMKLVLAEAKATVPVDTGLLASHLHVAQAKPKGGRMVMLVKVRKALEASGENSFVKISKKGRRAYTPAAVEFGHAGPRPAPPHPFLRTAFITQGPAARDKTLDDLLSATMREVGK